MYLAECFRHALSAGLLIDTSYFLRVVKNLEAEDLRVNNGLRRRYLDALLIIMTQCRSHLSC